MNFCKYDLNLIVENAAGRFEQMSENSNGVNIRQNLQVFSWPQLWRSTSCGFGGIGGAAITTAQTVVVKCMGINNIFVYHNSKFAYRIDEPNEAFQKRFQDRSLPGAADQEAIQTLTG